MTKMTRYIETPDPINPRVVHGVPVGEKDLHTVDSWCDCAPTITAVRGIGAAVLHHSVQCPDTIPEEWNNGKS